MANILRKSRRSGDSVLEQLEREHQSIERQCREYERMIKEEPERKAREQAEQAATMPPPDDLADRRREYNFYAKLSRGQLRNERRSQAGSILLFVLLITATGALGMWMLRIAEI